MEEKEEGENRRKWRKNRRWIGKRKRRKTGGGRTG